MDSIVTFIFQVVVWGLFSFTGRVALPFLTFGRWRVQRLDDYRSHVAWHGFKRQPNGIMLVSDGPAAALGVMVWVAVGILLFVLLR
jgi:hypothetical protein